MNDGKIFLYSAFGSALGGVIRRPFQDVIQAQASVSLPIVGGYGAARASDFQFHDLIRFSQAYTQVAGSQNADDGSYNTLVSSTIEGFNVADMVTADRIVARLSTRYGPEGEEVAVTPYGCEFVNLRVAGYPVDPWLDLNLFTELDTSRKFRERYERDDAFRKDMRTRCNWDGMDKSAPERLQQRYKWCASRNTLPESKGIIPCTLVKSIRIEGGGPKVYGNVIVVPQFGIIYLCEYQVKEASRRLVMMRFELGSPVDGDLCTGGIEGNGTTFP